MAIVGVLLSANNSGEQTELTVLLKLKRYDMIGRSQMQKHKNWILPKDINAKRFFWDSHWLEIWKNHLWSSLGPNEGSVAMDSDDKAFAGVTI